MATHATLFLLAALLPVILAAAPPPRTFQDAAATRQTVVTRPLSALLKEANTPPLSASAKRAIVSAAEKILASFNPHLTLYHTLYNVNPIARLNALSPKSEPLSNVAFHAAMTKIFTSMHDRHTVYLVPAPLRNSFATLRFRVRVFYTAKSPAERRYAVSALTNAYKPENTTFAAGVELLTWDGVPVDTVVRQLGAASYGSNPDARLENARMLLTTRLLAAEPIPFNPNVTLRFRDPAGKEGTFTVPWVFAEVKDASTARFMNRKFTPMAAEAEHPPPAFAEPEDEQVEIPGLGAVRIPSADRKPIKVNSQFQRLFSAEIIKTKSGPIGRFSVPTFSSNATKELVAEISRILRLMPKNGLVMDLRGNEGGRAEYVKVLTELITDKTVPVQPVSLRASRFAQQLYNGDLKGATKIDRDIIISYRAAVDSALKAGEPLTGPAPNLYALAPPGRLEQVYKGPLVTVVDGLTYSAGDLFAALQVDQKISPLVGTPGNVGAGGASTVLYSELLRIAPRLLSPLPGDVDFSTALARFFRSGPDTGAIVENFGVEPDIRYLPTFDDAVKTDCDLFEFLGKKLTERKALVN